MDSGARVPRVFEPASPHRPQKLAQAWQDGTDSSPGSCVKRLDSASSFTTNEDQQFLRSGRPPSKAYSPNVARLREAIYLALEEPDRSIGKGRRKNRLVRASVVVIVLLIVISVLCFILETMPYFAETPDEVWKAVEVATTCAFTVEYLLRFWVCDVFGTSAITWALKPMNLCDLLATLPMYAELLFASSDVTWLRVLRVVRLVKLGRYSDGVGVMTTALVNSMPALYILVFLFLIGVVCFSSVVFFTERLSCPSFEVGTANALGDFRLYAQECDASDGGMSSSFGTCCDYKCHNLSATEFSLCTYSWGNDYNPSGGAAWEVRAMHEQQFKSIVHGMWWASVTMTTVGYGDMYPKSAVSKLVGGVAMLSGMLIIAMPFAIIGTKFGEAVAYCEEPTREKLAVKRLKDTGWRNEDPDAIESMSRASTTELGSAAANTEMIRRLQALRTQLQESIHLKEQIIAVQSLRDNLWTSVEHSMATLAYEGLVSLESEALSAPPLPPALQALVSTPHVAEREHLVERSCCILHRDSFLRRCAIGVTQYWVFEWVVIFGIVANSALLAMQDYYPGSDDIFWNKLQETLEPVFLTLFIFECISKIAAEGFVMHERSYLRDGWNWIDFTVVVTGCVSIVLGDSGSQIQVLRTVRVLRPLRTLSAMPGLRKLVNTIIQSLPGLKDVVIMSLFLLTIFGILGLFFFGGVMHRQCRVTPQPLRFVPSLSASADCAGWCFDNTSTVVNYAGQSLQSSAVFAAFCQQIAACRETVSSGGEYSSWPIDRSQDRFCGEYECAKIDTSALESFGLPADVLLAEVLEPLGAVKDGIVQTVCGSPLTDDSSYGPHTVNSALKNVRLNDWEDEVFMESFNWGLTKYDQIGVAFLVIFQCVTLEGWVDIMYMIQDAYSNTIGFSYFLLLVVVGSFFLLNVTLAIVWDAFADIQDRDEEKMRRQKDAEEKIAKMIARRSKNAAPDEEEPEKSDNSSEEGGGDEESPAVEKRVPRGKDDDVEPPSERPENHDVKAEADAIMASTQTKDIFEKRPRLKWATSFTTIHTYAMNKKPTEEILETMHTTSAINFARKVGRNEYWNGFIMMIIALNVVLLALDKYETWPTLDRTVLESFTLVINIIFLLEAVVLHIALGPIRYWLDTTLAFDGVIVLLSVVDIAMSSNETSGSSVSALRAFRLLRIFKLAKRFVSMKVLLKAGLETLLGMREFVLLLVLIIVVFALVGQSFFAGKLLFDADTGRVLVPKGGPNAAWTVEDFKEQCPFADPPFQSGKKPMCVPRAHFDTFLWSCITVFQILSGENWNAVMYDGMKAIGWGAVSFFVMVIIFGQFVILNLFLAILMMNFEEQRSKHRAAEDERKENKRRNALIVMKAFVSQVQQRSVKAAPKPDFTESRSIPFLGTASGTLSHRVNNWLQKKWRDLSFGGSSVQEEQPDSQDRSKRVLVRGHSAPDVGELARSDTGGPGVNFNRVVPAPDTAVSAGVPFVETDLMVDNFSDDCPALTTLSRGPHTRSLERSQLSALTPVTNSSVEPSIEELPVIDAHRSGASTPISEFSQDTPLEPAQRSAMDDPPRSENHSTMALIDDRRRRSPGAIGWLCYVLAEVREFCRELCEQPWFDRCILVCILLSSATMCLQNPLADPSSTLQVFCDWVNTIFTAIFAAEMAIKIVALGLIWGQGSYLRSSWNVMDAVIVTISLIDVIAGGEDGGVLSFMKVFRIARMLRPLRIISRNPNLKIVVRTIGAALPELRNLLVFSSLFFLIFGLLGVSWFQGSFYRCSSSELEDDMFVFPDGGEGGITEVCIPKAPEGAVGTSGSMRFLTAVQTEDAQQDPCPTAGDAWAAGYEIYKRPSSDTPICEVRCDGDRSKSHPFCTNTHPWGYHVMRCTDCRDTFCMNADEETIEDCQHKCSNHHWFCLDQGEACLEQCMASCSCDQECNALSKDAALCVEQGGRWVNMNQNFDNILQGMISLFEISTTEGWVDVMLAGVDARGPMLQPKRDNQEVSVFLFVAFILVGSFFVLNLCVGVIIDNYHKQKDAPRLVMLTEAQQTWYRFHKALLAKRMFFPQTNLNQLSPTRQHLVRIVCASNFENCIMVCICLNTIAMGMTCWPSPGEQYLQALTTMNHFFSVVFNVEAVMKIAAYRTNYFKEPWNVFDFFCVFVSDVFFIVEASGAKFDAISSMVSALRIFRLARLFRLLRFLKGLNQLFFAFILSVPKLFNVACLMCLLIYLYAVLGVNLFAKVHVLSTHNELANFRTFLKACSVLVRSMTGEGWNEIMHDLGKPRFYFESYMDVRCEPYGSMGITRDNFAQYDVSPKDGFVDDVLAQPLAYECGNYVYSLIYFTTYTLIVTFVILNLFIAVIFEGFEESSTSEVVDLLEMCVERWRRYDPDQRMLIPLERAFDYVDEVTDALMRHHDRSNRSYQYESRFDRTGDHCTVVDGGHNRWSMYNLRYIKLNGFSVTEDHRVRFVVAVRAVIRRVVCQGGLGGAHLNRGERLGRLQELEILENQLYLDIDGPLPQKDVAKMLADEKAQNRTINQLLGTKIIEDPTRPMCLPPRPISLADAALHAKGAEQVSKKRTSASEEFMKEYSLLEQVAIAKIQRRFKHACDVFRNRRARAAGRDMVTSVAAVRRDLRAVSAFAALPVARAG